MNGLIRIGEQFLIDRMLSNDPPFSGKSKAGLSLMTVSALLFIASLAFLIYGAFLYLLTTYDPHVAALLSGLAILLLAAMCGCASIFILQYKKRRAMQAKEEMIHALHEIMDITDEEFGDIIADKPKTSVLISSALGYAAGQRFL